VTAVWAILGAVVVLALILRVGTAALIVSGVSRDVAAFQVRSAFFGVGFTTNEAEMIVNHPFRRRLIQMLMLAGSIGITGLIGSAVVTLARTDGSVLLPIIVLCAGLLLLWALTTWRPVDRFVVRFFERLLRRWTDLETHDYAALLRLSADYEIRQFTVHDGGVFDGRSLQDLVPRAHRVVLLSVERRDGTYLGAPTLDTTLQGGDILTVYGRSETLQTMASRADAQTPAAGSAA
jgi:hypothetical protein